MQIVGLWTVLKDIHLDSWLKRKNNIIDKTSVTFLQNELKDIAMLKFSTGTKFKLMNCTNNYPLANHSERILSRMLHYLFNNFCMTIERMKKIKIDIYLNNAN